MTVNIYVMLLDKMSMSYMHRQRNYLSIISIYNRYDPERKNIKVLIVLSINLSSMA